jgi:hypothetical protein
LSDVRTTFSDCTVMVDTFLFVIMTFVTCFDLAIDVATASPIFPAPMTATITLRVGRCCGL